jgi:anhydro-N-acetylmuramic acid kinase
MTELYLGLMSGTSMDGIDAALCEFESNRFVRVRAVHAASYPEALRADLLQLQRRQPPLTLAELARLDQSVASAFAQVASDLIRQAGVAAAAVRALGSHGQTVFHDPARATLQLGDPSRIAALTGVTTVADFRRADIARGGHGAPLVPAFHHAVFADAAAPRCVVNVGGIANMTVLPDADPQHVRGFDIGPGNALMDEWAHQHLAERMDAGGAWATSGRLNRALLDALLAEPYFTRAPPKSTGRSEFNLEWARRCHGALDALPAADVQRTFCELTARAIADAVRRHAPGTKELFVCGGGAFNPLLLQRIAALLDGRRVADTGALGLAPGDVEAAAFAWLAMRTMNGLPGNVPAVTGAEGPAVLGGIYRA